MANSQKAERREETDQATAAKNAGTQPSRNDGKEMRGGPKTNQISGETDTGARNQVNRNKNPTS